MIPDSAQRTDGPAPAARIGLLGAGGHAAEIAAYLEAPPAFSAVSGCFARGDGTSGVGGLLDIERADPAALATPVVAAVGAPGARRRLVAEWRGTAWATVVARQAWVAASASIEPGSVVAPFAVINAGVRLGGHVTIGANATVSHDSVIGDFATICPGAALGGRVIVGEGALVGIGAVVRDHVVVGAGAVIGAGAVLLADAEPLGVYVGAPARRIRTEEDWLERL